MHKFLALLFGASYWTLRSALVKTILKAKGIKVGKNFMIQGTPFLKIRGKVSNVSIGNDVLIAGDIDLRTRENGCIVIEDGVVIDDNCRFVAANTATLRIGAGTALGRDCIFNCGSDVSIGKKCLFASFVYINSSAHVITGRRPVIETGYEHGPVSIEDGAFIGAFVSINMRATIKKGAVVGSNSVVTHDLPEFSINVGAPAKTIRFREGASDNV